MYKILIFLSATTGVCIVSHTTVVDTPVGKASAGFTVTFSLAAGIIKKLIKHNKKQKEKAQ